MCLYDWLSPENKVQNLERGGAYLEMMCEKFRKLNFFSVTDVFVGDMSVFLHKKNENKNQSRVRISTQKNRK